MYCIFDRYHQFKSSGQTFNVPSRYKLIKPVGHGAYGIVVAVSDTVTNRQLAIKKIRNAFEDPTDGKRILREIKLMKRWIHENVINIIDLIPPPPGAEEFEDVYILQELMETDLHRKFPSRCLGLRFYVPYMCLRTHILPICYCIAHCLTLRNNHFNSDTNPFLFSLSDPYLLVFTKISSHRYHLFKTGFIH